MLKEARGRPSSANRSSEMTSGSPVRASVAFSRRIGCEGLRSAKVAPRKKSVVQDPNDRFGRNPICQRIPERVLRQGVPGAQDGSLKIAAHQLHEAVLKTEIAIPLQRIGRRRQGTPRHRREDIDLRQQPHTVEFFHHRCPEHGCSAPSPGEGQSDEPAVRQFLFSQVESGSGVGGTRLK